MHKVGVRDILREGHPNERKRGTPKKERERKRSTNCLCHRNQLNKGGRNSQH